MNGVKKIILVGIVIAIMDVAIIWVLQILDFISAEYFTNLIKDSLSVIGVIVLAGVVISALLSFKK